MIAQRHELASAPLPFGILLGAFLFIDLPASARPLDMQAVNGAQLEATPSNGSPFITKAQILLARANFSPGEIDGNPGENLDKAIAAFASSQGVTTNKLTPELWQKLSSMSDQPALI